MSETLTERILTRFAPADHEKLRAAAEAAGLTKTEAVRSATMRAVDEGSLGKARPPVTSDKLPCAQRMSRSRAAEIAKASNRG